MAQDKVNVSKLIKSRWTKSLSKLSLKEFARKLLKDGDLLAKDWFSHKSATWNNPAKALRMKVKGVRIANEKNATKLARRKLSKSSGGGKQKVTSNSAVKVAGVAAS